MSEYSTLHAEKCPLCQRSRFTFYGSTEKLGRTWQYSICRHCGLVFQNPRMTDEAMREYYRDNYWELKEQTEIPPPKLIRRHTERARHLLELLPEGSQIDRVLDIGCATGLMLDLLKARGVRDLVGVEMSQKARSESESKGHRVFETLDDLIRTGEPPFDLVILSHVLEHIASPSEFILRLRKEALRNGGILLVEVPNVHSNGFFGPAHVTGFCPRTLHDTLAICGARILQTRLHNAARLSRPPQTYLSMAAEFTSDLPACAVRKAFVPLEKARRAFHLAGKNGRSPIIAFLSVLARSAVSPGIAV